MKSKLAVLLVPYLLVFLIFSTGCASARLLKDLPEISAQSVTYQRSGKFSATTITVQNMVSTDKEVTADTIDLVHSDPWMINVELHVRGYRREKQPGETANPLPVPVTPATAAVMAIPKVATAPETATAGPVAVPRAGVPVLLPNRTPEEVNAFLDRVRIAREVARQAADAH